MSADHAHTVAALLTAVSRRLSTVDATSHHADLLIRSPPADDFNARGVCVPGQRQ